MRVFGCSARSWPKRRRSSPQAHHQTAKDSDVFTLRMAAQLPKKLAALDTLWLGAIANTKHMLLLGFVSPDASYSW